MLLMDAVAQVAGLASARNLRDPVFRGYVDLAAQIQGTPRYLLDAAACRTAVEISLGRPAITRQAMAHLRIPYRRLWVEWDDADRQRMRNLFMEELSHKELRPIPSRVGFLLEADETGRRGVATWAWISPSSDTPNIGAIQPHFDLDRVFHLGAERIEGMLKGNLARIWEGNPVQLEALFDIWRTTEHKPTDWAASLWDRLPSPKLGEALSYSDVVGEYITIWAVMLMITASRTVLDYAPVSLGRLNKQRKKRGAQPLLDHTRISLHLDPQQLRPVVRRELGYTRKSPRVHMVSSYLARRGNRHWLVQPYFRGSGEQIHRVVDVRG